MRERYTKQTRPFTGIHAAQPTQVSAVGQYNFFTPDERISEESSARYEGAGSSLANQGSGQNKLIFRDSQGRITEENNIKGTVPRLIKISFTPPFEMHTVEIEPTARELQLAERSGIPIDRRAERITQPLRKETNLGYDLNETYRDGKIYTPERVQSPFDLSFRIMDLSLKSRLQRKWSLASLVASGGENDGFAENSLTAPHVTSAGTAANDNTSINDLPFLQQILDAVIDQNTTNEVLDVNELGQDAIPNQIIKSAQFASIFGTIDRRNLSAYVDNPGSRHRLLSRILERYHRDDTGNQANLPSESNPGLRDVPISSEGELLPEGSSDAQADALLVGYMVERFESDEFKLFSSPEKVFFVSTPDANNFIDPGIKYGVFYTYTIRSVFKIILTENDASGVAVKRTAYVTSDPTDPVEARVLDTTPPNPPDGLRFRFNFNKRRGLKLFWQYPVGPTQDTKYFQIFRRASIHEPFTCIGLIDFDNSQVKSLHREEVRPDKILKYERCVTFFEDLDFKKDSKFIYAVASIDAHGYTSGYSTQVKVSFIKSQNRLVLTRISKAGAPKQFPNFFVDPDEDPNVFVNSLTQDCMKVSGWDKMTVYFDPDALKYMTSDSPPDQQDPENAKSVFYVNRPESEGIPKEGVYKMTVLNTDRQKSRVLEVSIDDARNTGFFK